MKKKKPSTAFIADNSPRYIRLPIIQEGKCPISKTPPIIFPNILSFVFSIIQLAANQTKKKLKKEPIMNNGIRISKEFISNII